MAARSPRVPNKAERHRAIVDLVRAHPIRTQEELVDALRGLRGRLSDGGSLVLFITRRTWLMRPLIGRWWAANLYDAGELEDAFRRARFSTVAFGRFPPAFSYLALWGYIVEARG